MGYRFAVIGCQHAHGSIFLQEMLELGHECVGIYDPEPDVLAKTMSVRYGVPLADHADALLEAADVIGCAAVNNAKIGILELCETAGKPVMLDKPAVVSRSGLERLQALLSRGRIEVGMLLTERFRPSLVTLKRLVDEGVLGELIHIGMRKPHRLSAARRPAWFFDKSLCGGIVIDLLVHDFDLLRWLTGAEIAACSGVMGKRLLPEKPTFYDWTSVQVEMTGRVGASLYADWHTPEASWTWGDGRLFVTGTQGTAELRLEGDPLVSGDARLLLVTNRKELHAVPLDEAGITVTADFLNRIEGKICRLTNRDVLAASEAAVRADEAVRIIE